MTKFIVSGSFFDAMACLDVECNTPAEAIKAWEEAFGDKVKGWYPWPNGKVTGPDVIDLDKRPDLLRFYHSNGRKFYSNGVIAPAY
jgi:hypothetical protein